jgi:peptidoglycan hydrolase CwlO-like protein
MAQAKMQATVLAEVVSAEDSSIAERFSSKQDVSQELVTIKASLDMINSKIDKSAAEVKGELIRWFVSVRLLKMALIARLVLKLVH